MTERLNRVTLTNSRGGPVLTLYGVAASGDSVTAEAYYLCGSLKALRVLASKEPHLRVKPPRLTYAGAEQEKIVFEPLTLQRVE